MLFTPKNIEQQLNQANIAIDNALAEPKLAQLLASFGYTAERMYQGRALREDALAMYQHQKSAYGDSQTANDAYARALKLARETYMRHVKVARIALEGERGALRKLGLIGERKQAQAAQLAQGRQFYTNVLYDRDILNRLANYGITQAMLEAGQRQFDTVVQCDAARRQRQGAAGDATRARNAALVALDDWMRDFKQVARVALRNRPQMLQTLGLPAPAARRASRSSSSIASETAAAAEHDTSPPSTRTLTAEDQSVKSAAGKRNGTKLAAVAE